MKRQVRKFEKWLFERPVKPPRSMGVTFALTWIPIFVVAFTPTVAVFLFSGLPDYVSGACLGFSFGALWMSIRSRPERRAFMQWVYGEEWEEDVARGRVQRYLQDQAKLN